MASATGIPEQNPATINGGREEEEPLLGRAVGVSQKEEQSIVYNLILGTATVAQAGIFILAALVWNGVFSHDLIFFSPHPILNSSAVLLVTQATLILQPTHTPAQKRRGTLTHFGLIVISNICFLAAFIIVEINKASHPETRFTSPHGILGLITYICVVLQAAVGVAQYFFPERIFGSVERGKKIYKYHRLSGYLILTLELATIAAATQTSYNVNVLHIRLWSVLVAAVLVLLGVGARIQKYKFGF